MALFVCLLKSTKGKPFCVDGLMVIGPGTSEKQKWRAREKKYEGDLGEEGGEGFLAWFSSFALFFHSSLTTESLEQARLNLSQLPAKFSAIS